MLSIHGGEPVRRAPFAPWPVHGPEDEQALLDVLHSNQWFLGDRIAEFEETFAAFQQARYGIGVSSGTTALQVALEAVGLQPGDEVIVPDYTFIATASSVAACGGIPIFADIQPGTCNLDPHSVASCLTDQTRAIIAVHIAGRPADLDALLELARPRGIRVIEDACQAHAAAWKGRRVGALADMGVFSFQASKNLCAGEGGFITTDDPELHARAWSLHNCGRAPDGAWYEHPLVGSNYRMSEFHAALLLSQLRNLETQTATRSRNARTLTQLLAQVDGIDTLDADQRVTVDAHHLFIFKYHAEAFGGASKERFIQALTAEGIPCAAGYRPLHQEEAFAVAAATRPFKSAYFGGKPDYRRVSCPVTEQICGEEGIWLTQSMLLGPEEDMQDIARALHKLRDHAQELRD